MHSFMILFDEVGDSLATAESNVFWNSLENIGNIKFDDFGKL